MKSTKFPQEPGNDKTDLRNIIRDKKRRLIMAMQVHQGGQITIISMVCIGQEHLTMYKHFLNLNVPTGLLSPC